MAVVVDKYIGSTHIIICDDYCRDKTPEDVERILNRVMNIALDAWAAHGIKDV